MVNHFAACTTYIKPTSEPELNPESRIPNPASNSRTPTLPENAKALWEQWNSASCLICLRCLHNTRTRLDPENIPIPNYYCLESISPYQQLLDNNFRLGTLQFLKTNQTCSKPIGTYSTKPRLPSARLRGWGRKSSTANTSPMFLLSTKLYQLFLSYLTVPVLEEESRCMFV